MKVLVALVGLFVMAGSSMSARADDTYNLKIASILDSEHPVIIGARRMAEVAERESHGRLKIQIFPSSQLGSQREIWQSVQSGVIDGVVDATANLANFVPAFSVLDLPYLVKDEDAAFRLLDGPAVNQELGARAEAAGFHIVKYWEVTFRNVYTRSKPIASAQDLKGLKIRVIPNPSFIALFRALNAAPTPMAYGEVYTSLQQGVIDGAENDLVTYLSSKHYEVAKNLALTNHMMLIIPFTLSERTWKRLPPDLQAVLTNAAEEGRKVVQAERTTRNAKALDQARALGINVTQPDLQPFIDAGRKTYADMAGRVGQDLVNRITGPAP